MFVSHNMPTIHQLTGRCVYLSAGQVVCVDLTLPAVEHYLEDSFATKTSSAESLDYYRRGNTHESSVRFTRIQFLSEDGKDEIETIRPGDPFCLEISLSSEEFHERACLDFSIQNDRGERSCTFFSVDQNFWFPIRTGNQRVTCTVRGLPLSPGRYTIAIGVNRTSTTLAFDVLVDYPAFTVVWPELESGKVDWPGRSWGAVHWTNAKWVHCGLVEGGAHAKNDTSSGI